MRKARHFSKVFDSFIMSLSIFRGQILPPTFCKPQTRDLLLDHTVRASGLNGFLNPNIAHI